MFTELILKRHTHLIRYIMRYVMVYIENTNTFEGNIEYIMLYNIVFESKSVSIYSRPYIPILLTVCNNISEKNVIKPVKLFISCN